MDNILPILLLLLAGTGAIILQIFLSKKENKWAGLILPIISLLISLSVVFSAVAFIVGTTVTQSFSVDGEIVELTVTETINDTSTIIATAAYLFLICNIPTAVLVAIFKVCRSKRGRQLELDKMNVQDLE